MIVFLDRTRGLTKFDATTTTLSVTIVVVAIVKSPSRTVRIIERILRSYVIARSAVRFRETLKDRQRPLHIGLEVECLGNRNRSCSRFRGHKQDTTLSP